MIIYDSKATDFFNLGLGVLDKVLEATVTEERNGAFYLEFKTLYDERIKENNIVKTDAGHLLKDQRFIIKKITDNHDGTSEVYAVHCSYLAQELTLKPATHIAGATATQALIAWKDAIHETHPFLIYSDVETVGTTEWTIDKVDNPRRALGGVRGSILDVWGGEYQFDNYLVKLFKKRGTTAQTVLAYGRNITGFEMTTNIDEVYTSVYPFAIEREADTIITIDRLVVDVEGIENYPNRRTLPIDFSDKFDEDNPITKAKLTTLAQSYIADNKIGVPKVNIKVNFLDLSQTADYAQYKQLEQVNLCDEVRVVYPQLNVDSVAKVIRIVWNCLTKSYDEIEIGEKRISLGSKLNEQEKQIEEIKTQTNHAQLSADGKNMIFYGLYGENGLGEPTATKVGDMWFKPNGENTDLYIWNGTIWEIWLSQSVFDELDSRIEQAEQDTQNAIDTAEEGLNKAEQAILDAGFATDLAEQAQALAGTTQTALSVEAGKISALNTLTSGHTTQIGSLQSSYSGLSSTVSQVQTELNGKATTTALSALEQNLNGFKTTVQDTYANKSTVTQLATQWQQTTNLVDGHTSQISSLGEQINLRVSKNDIINQINISTEGILIAGNKVRITGQTSIDNGVIKTAMIGDLQVSGAKIADASISSAKIINLDADKITVGTLTGFTINSAYINGGEIRGNSLIYLNNGTDNVVLTALNGFSTTRTVAANGIIRSGDWIYAGTNSDGTWKAGYGFQGERLRTHYIDPIYNNAILNIGQLSTTAAKVQVHLDSVFKRSIATDIGVRFANLQSQPAAAGMMTVWCGDAYAGYGLYVTSPNGATKSLAIF